MFVVNAQHCPAIERQPLQEIDECLLEPLEIMAVGIHVVGVDVGHDGHDRRQAQEAGVRFVGLGNQIVSRAQAGIAAGGRQAAADHEGRVQSGASQRTGDQAGRGRLAVRTGNGDALLEAHQFGQHLRTRHDGNAGCAGSHHFRVVSLHGR